MYAKANIGVGLYLLDVPRLAGAPGPRSPSAATSWTRSACRMAGELMLFQGIHNGADYETQAAAGCYSFGNCIQGDVRVYTIAGLYEFSIYPTRRLGIGIRAGGGLSCPLLMDEGEYETTVVKEWNNTRPTVHDQAHPVVIGGPTASTTKLSHFSVGIDVDASYAVGFDLGLSTTGTVKDTF